MSIHSEERRIAGLLRELMLQKGVSAEAIEGRLGWQAGRLEELLEGKARLGFDELLEILPILNVTPGEFFAGLYGFEPSGAGTGTAAGEVLWEVEEALDGGRQRVLDRRFEESRRVVREAVARRVAWKRQREAMAEGTASQPSVPASDRKV